MNALVQQDVESMEAQLKHQLQGIPKEYSQENGFLENLIL